MRPSSVLPIVLASFALAQDNVMYGYVGSTCSSPDFTVFPEPGQCLGVTNPPQGYQSTNALFYEDGCQGYAAYTHDCTGPATEVVTGVNCIPAPPDSSFLSYYLICNGTGPSTG